VIVRELEYLQMVQENRSNRVIAEIWAAVRNMIEPELVRYRTRFPHSRRRAILEEMATAALREDEAALADAGLRYLRLTRTVPPGCYALCRTRRQSHYLAGERVTRKRGEVWSIHRFSPQVWR
jgi:hypothetical protein